MDYKQQCPFININTAATYNNVAIAAEGIGVAHASMQRHSDLDLGGLRMIHLDLLHLQRLYRFPQHSSCTKK